MDDEPDVEILEFSTVPFAATTTLGLVSYFGRTLRKAVPEVTSCNGTRVEAGTSGSFEIDAAAGLPTVTTFTAGGLT